MSEFKAVGGLTPTPTSIAPAEELEMAPAEELEAAPAPEPAPVEEPKPAAKAKASAKYDANGHRILGKKVRN